MVSARILSQLPEIEKFLGHCERRQYRGKSVIVRSGEPGESFFFVLEGTLSIVIPSDDGTRDIVVSYLNPGEFFGEVGLYRRFDNTREASVHARTDCEVAEIRYDKFLALKELFPDILHAISCQMADRLTDTTKKLGDLAFVDTRGRIINALHGLCQQPGAMTHPKGIQIKVSRQELARIVGCSREVAGRMLKSLEKDGLVEVSGHTIVVPGAR